MPAHIPERSRFLLARMVVPPALEEQAVAALWDSGCLGVQVIASGRLRRLTLDAYYPGRGGTRRLGSRLQISMRRAGLAGRARPRVTAVRAGGWVERWQRSLRPMTIGRFLIVPEGCLPGAPRRGRHLIRVRFGQAFGTGEHASTRMCLMLMKKHLAPGASVADVGTGSGILAMAACRLGAGRVIALDNDEVALGVADQNLKLNDLEGRVRLMRADAAAARGEGPFDLALINIGAATIERLIPDLTSVLRPGGRAILSGLLVDDEKGLLRAAAPSGLRRIDRRRSPPWSALVLRRPPRRQGKS